MVGFPCARALRDPRMSAMLPGMMGSLARTDRMTDLETPSARAAPETPQRST